METSLKPAFAQIFSCCPNNLNCRKSGGGGEGGCSLLRHPARTPMPGRGMRERERTYTTQTNIWSRGTNQKVAERPVENCNITAENAFTL